MHKIATKPTAVARQNPRAARHRLWRRMSCHGLLLGILFALAASFSTSYAQVAAIACGEGEQKCRLSGDFSAVSVAYPELPGIESSSSPAFGALVYTDFKKLEAVAREHLDRAVTARQSFSPYQGNVGFDEFIRKLNSEAGLSDVYNGTTPYGANQARIAIVNAIEADLARARNIYGFLAVFAPQNRFRSDSDYMASLCAKPENANPEDPTQSGVVLPPDVDWCDFKARLRQSVREAANVRMLIGQEFMVKALGMNFGGDLTGTDEYVRLEIARLRAAQNQYKLAEKFLTDGLNKAVGNGCLISDFYTDAEWSLLSRSSEQQGTVQYLIGSRLSYLGVSSVQGAANAKASAQATIRQGANDNYLKLLGIAGEARINKPRCELGEHPNGDAIAEMALNVLDAQRQARDLAAGRNIFGFDVTLTPAAPYLSSAAQNCETLSSDTRGLWDAAKCAADIAVTLQDRAENKQREFEQSQEKLITAVRDLESTLDTHIDDVVGCNYPDLDFDHTDFFNCAEEQIKLATDCLKQAHLDSFDACMEAVNDSNDIDTALQDLRGAYLEYQGIQNTMFNFNTRIVLSADANKTVTDWLLGAGTAETVARVAQSALDVVNCADFDNVESLITSGATCSNVGGLNALAQTAAGSASTMADIAIADAENKAEIQNMLLDMSETAIAAQAALQAFKSKYSDTEGMLTALMRDVIMDKRQRAYFAASPANDPAFRIVRDSARLQLADAMEEAAKLSYLAARRAEYEYAARLSVNGFRISDIYRARTAQDILIFLEKLKTRTTTLAGSANHDSTLINLPRISVVKNILYYTDDVLQYLLQRQGQPTTPEAISAERNRRFQEWVTDHTVIPPGIAQKPILVFTMTTSLLDGGLYANLTPEDYDSQWRFMLGGIGTNGVRVNLVSDQPGNLAYRKVTVTQSGLVHLRSFAGCIFDYHLMAPAFMLGNEWPNNQDPSEAFAFFSAKVNDPTNFNDTGFVATQFQGRPVSATEWKIEIRSGAPEAGLADMDFRKLTDIELLFSATYTSRQRGDPNLADCARVDY